MWQPYPLMGFLNADQGGQAGGLQPGVPLDALFEAATSVNWTEVAKVQRGCPHKINQHKARSPRAFFPQPCKPGKESGLAPQPSQSGWREAEMGLVRA